MNKSLTILLAIIFASINNCFSFFTLEPNPFNRPFLYSEDKFKISNAAIKGFISLEGKKAVIISDGKKNFILSTKDRIGDYLIKNIEKDFITLSKNSKEITINFK